MPVTRVRLQAALWGGVVSAVLFELAKFGFSLYLSRILGSYKSIYGALGLLPLFLLWIYLAWLILLWGVEIAHAHQRLPALEAAERRADPSGEHQVVVSDALALHILGEVARHFAAGKKALPEDALEERYGLSEKAVRLICRRLEECNLLIPVNDGYLLARPAERIPVSEALAALRPALPQEAVKSPVGRLCADLDAQAQGRIGPLTLADLV
jgi:membrane protein